MNKVLAAALGKLANRARQQCAGSELTKAQRRALERFAHQTGCVRMQPQGRGVTYRVVNPALFARHLRELQPVDPADRDPTLPVRAANIATGRSSKLAAHRHETCYLMLKAAAPGVAWQGAEGVSLDLSRATGDYGAAVLAIRAEDRWTTAQPLWLVENQALFDHLDWVPPGIGGSVTCYGGQLRKRLLDWLAACPRTPRLLLFPDYDGVGLYNYARLRDRVGERAEFWLMPDWRTRLERFGNPDIWRNTLGGFQAAQPYLDNLPPSEAVMALVSTLHRKGLALEQEAVWL